MIIILINHDWSISHVTVSDKNFKFLFEFWKTIFRKLRTKIFITTTWYSSANNQSKRTNQIIEIAFRYHTTAHSNNEWVNVLSFLQVEKNNVIHASTDYALNEFVYDFKINDTFDLLTNLSSKNYSQLRQLKRKKAKSIMTFVAALSKFRYDAVHQALDI